MKQTRQNFSTGLADFFMSRVSQDEQLAIRTWAMVNMARLPLEVVYQLDRRH